MSYQLKKFLTRVSALVLGLIVAGGAALAQNRVITGTVTDDLGEPLIGASVTLEGDASVGAITDLDGHYSITVPASAQTLRFSFIGQEDAVETIGDRSVINVKLASANIALTATVVTAMGIRKEEKSLSYNVQQAKLESVSPVGSFVNSLNGKVAGVSISQSSTGVGGSSRIVMRGSKSINNNNNALYVIDGVPMQSLRGSQPEGIYAGAGQTGDILGTINQEDIESISVLSGPSAAALYGANAANGVIIITTKKGDKDKLEINYSNNTSFSRAYVMPEFQNTYGVSDVGSYYSWGAKLGTPSSYNPRNFFQTGVNEVNSLSLSSGNDRSQTYVSASVANARGIVHNNNVGRYNLSFRNTTELVKDVLSLDVNLTYGHVEEQNMIAQGEYHNPVVPVYLFPAGADFSKVQIYERYDAGRNMKVQYWPYDVMSMQNPYWITEHEKFLNTKNRLMGSGQLSWKALKWLTLSARAKYDRTDEVQDQLFDASTNTLYTRGSSHGFYHDNKQYTEQKFAEALATFNKYWGDNVLNLSGVVGANIDDITFRSDAITGGLYKVNNQFTFSNIDKSNSETRMATTGYRYQNQSVFANAQLGWRSRVYLDMTFRADWNSSLWTAGAITYPTVGLSGIITELLPGLKSSFFPYWKVRASYSEVGNTPNPADHLLDPRYLQDDKGEIALSKRRKNLSLQPERTKSWEVGTNLHLLDSRIQLDATYYKSSSYNQFYNPKVSSTSNTSDIFLNGGRVDNHGVELSLRLNDQIGKFNYGTYFTWTWNQNKIVDLTFTDPETGEVHDGNGMTIKGAGFSTVYPILYEGGSLGDLYVSTVKTDENGFYDLTSSGMIQANNTREGMIYAGSTDAKHRLSWGGHLGYGGLTASFLFTARLGGIAVSQTQAVLDWFGASQDSANLRETGYLVFNGMKTSDIQGYYAVVGGQRVMSEYVYDATNVRLAEVSLGYDLPVAKWGWNWLKGINVAVVGNNLAMLYLKAPFDPEMTASVGTYNQGLDYFMQPSTRSLGFSVKVKFGGSTANKVK